MYILAKQGVSSCRRLWDDFAGEVPGMARLVVADVESGKTEMAEATKGIDKVLAKAEKPRNRKRTRKNKLVTKAESLPDYADPRMREWAREQAR